MRAKLVKETVEDILKGKPEYLEEWQNTPSVIADRFDKAFGGTEEEPVVFSSSFMEFALGKRTKKSIKLTVGPPIPTPEQEEEIIKWVNDFTNYRVDKIKKKGLIKKATCAIFLREKR